MGQSAEKGHPCGVPRCDGTRLGHDLAVDFPEETRQVDEGLDRIRRSAELAHVEPLQSCDRCGVLTSPGAACVSAEPGHLNAERTCRPARATCDQWCDPQTGVHAPWCSTRDATPTQDTP